MSQTSINPYEAPQLSLEDNLLQGPRRLPGEMAVVWTLWLTYGAFYFCRTNISAAVPGLKASVENGGLGLSASEVGWILASLKIAYGIGTFFTGQQITLGLTSLIACQAARLLCWHGALYAPSGLLVATGIFMLICLRESP